MEAGGAEGGVNALSANQRVLQCFWDLSTVEEDPRCQAAARLVGDVLEDQASNAPANPGDPMSLTAMQALPKPRQLEQALRGCSPLTVYTLRRLARGLGSGRAASRQGFAAALAALLGSASGAGSSDKKRGGAAAGLLGVPELMILLDGCMEATGSGKGGDARDALMGRLFGLGAAVRGGLVRDAGSAGRVAAALLSLAQKKAFVREAVVAVLIEMLLGGPGGKAGPSATWLEPAALGTLLGKGAGACEPLRAFLTVSPADATPEALLLALCLWPHMPADLQAVSPLPKGAPAPPASFVLHPEGVAWSKVAPTAAALMAPTYLGQILPALRATTSAAPRLHSLWTYLMPYLLPGFKPSKGEKGEAGAVPVGGAVAADAMMVEGFWLQVCEEGLFTSSHERKHLALQLFQLLLPRTPAAAVPSLFSRNLVRTLADNLRVPGAFLHAMARRVMERISAYVEKGAGVDGPTRMAITSALHRVGLSTQAKGKGAAKLVPDMEPGDVAAFFQGHMDVFLSGAAAAGAAAANGAAAAAAGAKRKRGEGAGAGEDGEEEEGSDGEGQGPVSSVERARAAAVEGLAAAVRMPAASDEDRALVLRFLATHAFFAPSPDAAAAAPAPATPSAKKTPSKKKATPALPAELEAAAKAAADGAEALTQPTRLLCAARLLALASHAPSTPAPAADGASADGAAGAEAQGAGRGRKRAKGPEGAPQAGAHAPHAAPGRLLPGVVAHVRALMRAPGTQVVQPLPEAADAALTVLQDIEDAVTPLATSTPPSARARAMLQLVQLLQLHVLGDPENAPEPGLVMDLRRVAVEAVGAQLPEVEEQVLSQEGEETNGSGEDEKSEEDASKPSWSELLVDVLLSLLSRPAAPLPSAPLRGACEALWRSACDGLTAEGLQDLVRVITSGSGAGGEEDEDVMDIDQDEEEEEDGIEEEVGGSSSDEDEDTGDEKEGAADGEEAKTGKGAKAAQAGQADKGAKGGKRARGVDHEGEGSESEEESEGMDDEEMFRMDKYLGAHLRNVMTARRNAREQKAALAALKFRALALLEAFGKKAPASPLLLLPLLPLLRTLAAASRPGGDSALASRVRAVINGLCKAKPVYDAAILPLEAEGAEPAAAAATLPTVLRKVVAVAARAPERGVAEAASNALGTLLRATAAAPTAASDAAAAAYTSALDNFFTSKRSRLTRAGLQGAGARAPAAALAPAPLGLMLKVAGGAARNAFKQMEALELLSGLLKSLVSSQQQAPSSGQLSAVTPSLRSHAHALGAALAAAAGGGRMKPDHQAAAIKACVGVVESLRKLFPDKKLPELVGPENLSLLAKTVVTVRELGVPERVSVQLGLLAQAAGIASMVEGSGAVQPDPALKARLLKARAKQAAEGKEGDKGAAGKKVAAGGKGDAKQKAGAAAGGKQERGGKKGGAAAGAASPGKGPGKQQQGDKKPDKKEQKGGKAGKVDNGAKGKRPRTD